MATILDRVESIAVKELCVHGAQVVPDANFWDDLYGDDPIHWRRFILRIEEEFELHIPPQDGERIVTVQDLVNYLKRQGAKDEED